MTSKALSCRVVTFLLILVMLVTACSRQDAPATAENEQTPLSSDAAALEAMEVIEGRVSELRGLETLQPVTKALLTTSELRKKLEEDLLEDYSEQEARDDLLLYVAFDLVDRDIDLYSLLLDLYTEQVAGFYDPETKEMVVVKGEDEPGALERLTYAHEYTHALQDQHFDLEKLGLSGDEGEEVNDSEAQFAARSLVEGDASLLMQQYALQYFDADDFREVLDASVGIDSSVLDASPEVIRETLLFPYNAGMQFTVALFQDGGWPAVDAALAAPPVSTEQILHPSRYPDDVPEVLALPPLTDTLGAGWRLVDQDVLGEFGLQLYLKAFLEGSEAESAAEGWGGDQYTVYWREDESAFALAVRLAWDTPEDAIEFFDAYRDFSTARFGEEPTQREGEALIRWLGNDALLLAQLGPNRTLILIAPDEAMLDAIYERFADLLP